MTECPVWVAAPRIMWVRFALAFGSDLRPIRSSTLQLQQVVAATICPRSRTPIIRGGLDSYSRGRCTMGSHRAQNRNLGPAPVREIDTPVVSLIARMPAQFGRWKCIRSQSLMRAASFERDGRQLAVAAPSSALSQTDFIGLSLAVLGCVGGFLPV